jgi:hypothetical protein
MSRQSCDDFVKHPFHAQSRVHGSYQKPNHKPDSHEQDQDSSDEPKQNLDPCNEHGYSFSSSSLTGNMGTDGTFTTFSETWTKKPVDRKNQDTSRLSCTLIRDLGDSTR